MATAAKPQNITPDQKSFGARILISPSRRPIKSASHPRVNGADRAAPFAHELDRRPAVIYIAAFSPRRMERHT
jgi:hypothetical protein